MHSLYLFPVVIAFGVDFFREQVIIGTVMDKYASENFIVVSLLLGGLLLGHSDN